MEEAATRTPLDEEAFRHFAPLLQVSQDYASFSGCRFRSGSFDGLPTEAAAAADVPASVGPERARDPGPRLAAKLRASVAVADFAARLRSGEQGLVEEVDRAFRIVMVESVRNAMQSMFQALDIFPPTHPPRGIDEEDCAYEDTSAPLPAMAQRLYNDQVRRLSNTAGAGRLDKRARTAAYIVDFAESLGVPLPAIPETQRDMLSELSARVTEETQRRGGSEKETSRAREVFLQGLGAGAAAESLRQEASKWWAENWKTVAGGMAVTAAFGLAGLAVAAIARGAQQRRHPRDRDGSET